jgi:WhiB family transcriptional regulator, redox-sensing transcriptional regulator
MNRVRRSTIAESPGAAGPVLGLVVDPASEEIAAVARPDGPPDVPDWQDFALCAETDPEAFFPEKGGSTREAKKVCQSCLVRAECLEYALEHGERFGIWGGTSERERRRLMRDSSAVAAIARASRTSWPARPGEPATAPTGAGQETEQWAS